MTAVLGTVEVDAEGAPLDPVELAADGSTKLVPSTSIRIRFDRFLLPSTISRQALCLRSDTAEVTDFTKCTGGVFVQPTYDPVRREIVLRQGPGERLAFGKFYKLSLYLPEIEGDCTGDEPTSCGVRAFDGAPLETAFTIAFRILEEPPPVAQDEVAPPAPFCGDTGAAQALGNTCAYGNCHAPSDDGTGPAEGLSFKGIQMGDPTDTLKTAINHVAHGTQMGEAATNIEETPARFGRAMPIIDAFDLNKTGNPGNSYLLYKLLTGVSVAKLDPAFRPSDEEIARLRASVVVGMPMPASDPSTNPLDQEQLFSISAWIARGAPMPACP